MCKTDDREAIVKEIYKNLGISDCYDKDGGLGFELLKSGQLGSHTVILSDGAYKVLLQARRETDKSGIEHPFIIMGWFVPIDDDFALFCKEGIIGMNSSNDGRCRMSDELVRQASNLINDKNYGFAIICHTHPNYSQTSFDRTTYDRLLPYCDRLAIRDLGFNISNGDISQLIGMKKQQIEHDNNCYFLQGISLPNGEFNVVDIDFSEGEHRLVSLPKIMRLDFDNLVAVDNIWNVELRENNNSICRGEMNERK